MTSDPWNIAQSVATIATAVFAIPMIFFATRQLAVAAKAYQAAAEQAVISAKASSTAALGALAGASRELQWRVLQDKALHGVIAPESAGQGFSDEMKREAIRGMLISHYAFVYTFRQLGQIPDSTWPAFKVDMVDFFTREPNRNRWKQVKEYYVKEFQDFVDGELLQRPN